MQRANWYAKAPDLLASLLGYEHQNSVINTLKDKLWIVSGSFNTNERLDFLELSMTFILTEEGKKHVADVIEM